MCTSMYFSYTWVCRRMHLTHICMFITLWIHLYNYMYALVCRKSHVANSLLLTFRTLPSQLCQQIQIYPNKPIHVHTYVVMQCVDKWITCIATAAATNGTSLKLANRSAIIAVPVYSVGVGFFLRLLLIFFRFSLE